MLGPTLEELKCWASEGSIVVINITDERSDAIIVTASGVTSVALTTLTLGETLAWIQEDLTMSKSDDTSQDRGKKNKRYVEFLRWLWQKCVKSVLLAHGIILSKALKETEQMPNNYLQSWQEVQKAEQDSTAKIFLENGGFVAWFA